MNALTSEIPAKRPFPLLFAEKVLPIKVGGTYHDERQVRQNIGSASGTNTQSETNTGGYNDTDTNYDTD